MHGIRKCFHGVFNLLYDSFIVRRTGHGTNV